MQNNVDLGVLLSKERKVREKKESKVLMVQAWKCTSYICVVHDSPAAVTLLCGRSSACKKLMLASVVNIAAADVAVDVVVIVEEEEGEEGSWVFEEFDGWFFDLEQHSTVGCMKECQCWSIN